MRRFGEVLGAVVVVVILSCNVGCAKTATIPTPSVADQEMANQKVKADAAGAAKMYRDRLKALICTP